MRSAVNVVSITNDASALIHHDMDEVPEATTPPIQQQQQMPRLNDLVDVQVPHPPAPAPSCDQGLLELLRGALEAARGC